MNNKKKWVISGGILAIMVLASIAFILPAVADENVHKHEPTTEGRVIATAIVSILEQYHYSKPTIDDNVSHLLFDEYLKKLDPNKLYFLDSDIQEFAAYKDDLDNFLKSGNIDFAYLVYKRFLQRAEERIAYLEERLKEPFDFSVKEEFLIKREDASWAKSFGELDEEWRKHIKNQILQSKLQELKQIEQKNAEVKSENTTEANSTEPESTEANSTEPESTENTEANSTEPESTEANSTEPESTESTEANSTEPESTESTEANSTEPESTDNWKETPEERILKRYKTYHKFMSGNDNYYILELYLSSLTELFDPHSSYMNWRTLSNFNISLSLSLQGIGAVISSENGYPKISSIVPGGPADRQGELKAGYLIISVRQENGESTSVIDMPLNQVVQKIRGEKETKVILTCIKNIQGVPFNIEIVRGEVKLTEQEAKGETREISINDKKVKVGIITLPSFYSDFEAKNNDDPNAKSTTVDVKRILENMKKENVEGLIIDLRSNGGGSLEEVVNLTGLFIPSGPVVQIKDIGGEIEIREDDDDNFAYEMPLVVMVNTFSASASEIFAGAIQDYQRGIVVGGNTYGKGTVQNLLDLRRMRPLAQLKAGALKFTIAKFYRVTGASTQKKGVAPDISYPSLIDSSKYGEGSLPFVMPWDTITPLELKIKHNVKKYLSDLKEKHDYRIKNHPKFQSLQKYIEHIQERQDEKYVSLNLETRKQMQDQETEWYEQVNKILGESTQDSENEQKKEDLYMDETLMVLHNLMEQSSTSQE